MNLRSLNKPKTNSISWLTEYTKESSNKIFSADSFPSIYLINLSNKSIYKLNFMFVDGDLIPVWNRLGQETFVINITEINKEKYRVSNYGRGDEYNVFEEVIEVFLHDVLEDDNIIYISTKPFNKTYEYLYNR